MNGKGVVKESDYVSNEQPSLSNTNKKFENGQDGMNVFVIATSSNFVAISYYCSTDS